MIWLREIHEALLNRLKPLFNDLTDYYGNPINVEVFVRFPQSHIKSEHYPCVTIQALNTQEDLASTDLNSYNVVRKVEEGIAEVTQKPTMFDFNFQIDIMTKTPMERDSITERFITHTPSRTVLEVRDRNRNVVTCPLQFIQPFKTLDFISIDEERIYRNVIDLKVKALVQQHQTESYPMVEVINSKIK